MVVVSDLKGRTDGSAYDFLQKVDNPLPIVLVSWVEDFVFNPALLSVRDYVLVCFCEYGYDALMNDTHLWGVNSENFTRYYSEGYRQFDEWVKGNPPKIIFKRELLKKDAVGNVHSIQYTCLHDVPPVQSKEEFDNRVLQVFYSWGLSHEARKTVHSNIWRDAGYYGYAVCDNLFYLDGFIQNEACKWKWLTVNIPHYYRQPIETILQINGLAKISISIAGAGRVCFRHCEAPINSVMYMWEDEIKWAYEWVHSVNCIKSKEGNEIETIIGALQNHNLYDIYLAGTENVKKYQVNNYINNYILPIINKT